MFLLDQPFTVLRRLLNYLSYTCVEPEENSTTYIYCFSVKHSISIDSDSKKISFNRLYFSASNNSFCHLPKNVKGQIVFVTSDSYL